MNRRAMRITAIACVVNLLGLTSSTTTLAQTTPQSTIVNVNDTFINAFDCPFALQETISGAYRDTLYFDSAGNPVKEILTAQFGGPLTVRWTNPSTGATLSSVEAAPLIVYYNLDGSFASLQNVGVLFKVTIPGQGPVLLDVGRIVVQAHQGIVFEAGIHQELVGDTSAFCTALS